jgi:cell volume regulation protein A
MPTWSRPKVTDTQHYALLVLLIAAVGLVAVLSNRLTHRVKIPSPALVLVGAAVAVKVVPSLHTPTQQAVERIVTVALACILFDGGMHIGWARFRSSAGPIAMTGVLGTFGTVAAAAVLGHVTLGLAWYAALLAATAVAPTDPAMVFSVLGQREVAGRSGTILEGESGANDPVGIALMTAVIAAGGLGWHAFADVGGGFLLQMVVGAAIGGAGGGALLWFIRRVPLPSEGLYPLRTLASALLLYGLATLAHGSGFLAVFIAGIVLGDQRAPYKREVERFHSALASLSEIVAFAVLGLTIDLGELARADVWLPGVAAGAVLSFVIRPVLVGLCLWPARLESRERLFVLFAGLKGAVPILLGSYLLAAHVPNAPRLYGIVVVVVIFSVFVQASLVPAAARLLRIRMRRIEPQPWALGVRLADEPTGVHQLTIRAESPADGRAIRDLADLPGEAWVSFVVRDGQLVPISEDTVLRPGDEVLVLADPALHGKLVAAFEKPAALSSGAGGRGSARGCTGGRGSARVGGREADIRRVDGPGAAAGRAVIPPVEVGVCDHLLRGRGAVLGEVLGGMRVADQRHVIAADEGAVDGRADAHVGLGACHDQPAHAARGEHRLQVGVLERVAVALVDDGLTVQADKLRHVLPALAVPRHVVVGVLHPDHGHVLRAGLADQGVDVRDHAVAVVGAGHHAVLDVDDKQRGVRPAGERRHGSSVSGRGSVAASTVGRATDSGRRLALGNEGRQPITAVDPGSAVILGAYRAPDQP